MNVDNGHLIRLGIAEKPKDFRQEIQRRMAYFDVPPELQFEAERELDGKNETYVDIKANTPLANWASKKRTERDKKKNKRHMAKKSKRRNRA